MSYHLNWLAGCKPKHRLTDELLGSEDTVWLCPYGAYRNLPNQDFELVAQLKDQIDIGDLWEDGDE